MLVKDVFKKLGYQLKLEDKWYVHFYEHIDENDEKLIYRMKYDGWERNTFYKKNVSGKKVWTYYIRPQGIIEVFLIL